MSKPLKGSFVCYPQQPENLSDDYLVMFRFNCLLLYAFFEGLEMKRLLNQILIEQPVRSLRMVKSFRYLFIKLCYFHVFEFLNKIEISLFQHLNLISQIYFDSLNWNLIINFNLFDFKETTKLKQKQKHSVTTIFLKPLYLYITKAIFYHLIMQLSVINKSAFH